MNSDFCGSPPSIAPSIPSIRSCNTEPGPDVQAYRAVRAPSCLSDALQNRPYAPAANINALLPKAGVTRNSVASVGPGEADAVRGNLWCRLHSIKMLIAAPWNHWRSEREVQRATRALAGFDDGTLRNLGIPDRSQIEFTVRFCREC
jgi:hypothetical protein